LVSLLLLQFLPFSMCFLWDRGGQIIMTTDAELVRSCVFVSDAAMGTALVDEDRVDLGPWWSSSVVITNPEVIRRIHRQNIDAGSDVILTATYQAYAVVPPACLVQSQPQLVEFPEEALRDVCDKAVRVARSAVDEANKGHSVLVAGSIGPIGSALPGAQEFIGSYTVDKNAANLFYGSKIEALLLSLATIPHQHQSVFPSSVSICFETFPRLDEAVFALEIFEETVGHVENRHPTSLPLEHPLGSCTMSFVTHNGDTLPCGTPVENILPALDRFISSGMLVGFGFNCSLPCFAERAAMKLVSLCQAIELPSCMLIWKPNMSPEAVRASCREVNDLPGDFRASTRRLITCVLENAHANEVNLNAKGKFVFDRILCGGCCGTTEEEVRWISQLRARSFSEET
jgi:homocysteine S-methyltransferase